MAEKEERLEVVKYKTESGDQITLNVKMVRATIAFGGFPPNDAEVIQFMMLCKSFRLNPWLREVYLIKYSEKDTATTVLGKDLFNKRASNHPKYDGQESGLIVETKSKKMYDRTGSFKLKDDVILGAWAKTYRRDWSHPVETRVLLEEYIGRKRDGSLNRQWATKEATMITKVAKVQGWREAFPDILANLYDSAEIQYEAELPDKPVADVPSENFQVGPEEESQVPPEEIPGVQKGTEGVSPEETEEMQALKEQILKELNDPDFTGEVKMEGYDELLNTAKYRQKVPEKLKGYVPLDRLQNMADQISLLLLACKDRNKDSKKGKDDLFQDGGKET